MDTSENSKEKSDIQPTNIIFTTNISVGFLGAKNTMKNRSKLGNKSNKALN